MKRLTIQEAERLLKIDKNNLDEEMVRHPVLLAEIGRHHVAACDDRDRAKDVMENADAVTYLTAKRAAVDKPTDYSVKQTAKASPKAKRAQERYRDAKAVAAGWEVLWTAFMQRSFMLNKLAELYTAQFYSSDSSYQRPSYERKKHVTRKKRATRKRHSVVDSTQ